MAVMEARAIKYVPDLMHWDFDDLPVAVDQNVRFEADVRALADAYPHLLRCHTGQWALIVGARLAGVYDDRPTALQRGYDLSLLNGFIVQQVTEGEAQKLADWLAASAVRAPWFGKYAGRIIEYRSAGQLDWSGA